MQLASIMLCRKVESRQVTLNVLAILCPISRHFDLFKFLGVYHQAIYGQRLLQQHVTSCERSIEHPPA